jgi:hypothetical protein
LNLDASLLGIADSAAYVGLFLGTLMYARWLKAVPFRTIYFWSQLSIVPFILLDYVQIKRWNIAMGIPDFLFVLGGDTLGTVFSRFKSMPFLVMAAQLCPPDIEATFFSLLMSISNLSDDAATLFGSYLIAQKGITEDKFDGLDELTLWKAAGTLVPLLFLWLVPNVSNLDSDEYVEKSEKTTDTVHFEPNSEEDTEVIKD